MFTHTDGLVSSEARTRPSREIELDLRALQKLEKRFVQSGKNGFFENPPGQGWEDGINKNKGMPCPSCITL